MLLFVSGKVSFGRIGCDFSSIERIISVFAMFTHTKFIFEIYPRICGHEIRPENILMGGTRPEKFRMGMGTVCLNHRIATSRFPTRRCCLSPWHLRRKVFCGRPKVAPRGILEERKFVCLWKNQDIVTVPTVWCGHVADRNLK